MDCVDGSTVVWVSIVAIGEGNEVLSGSLVDPPVGVDSAPVDPLVLGSVVDSASVDPLVLKPRVDSASVDIIVAVSTEVCGLVTPTSVVSVILVTARVVTTSGADCPAVVALTSKVEPVIGNIDTSQFTPVYS